MERLNVNGVEGKRQNKNYERNVGIIVHVLYTIFFSLLNLPSAEMVLIFFFLSFVITKIQAKS